jgi:hypothetical protein
LAVLSLRTKRKLLGCSNGCSAGFVATKAGLRDLGWPERRDLRLDYCFVPDASRLPAQASDLVGLAPDLILAVATPVAGLLPVSRTLPIVFVYVTDPVGSGLVPNLARPGGKLTGFTSFEFSIGSKWVDALKEIAPFAPLLWQPVVDAAGANRNTTSPSNIRRFSNTSARQIRHTVASIINSAAIAPS